MRTLQPLLKSLMQDVHSHMAEGSRGRGGICACDVWRNGDPCAVMFKQRFPQQPHAPLVPLSRLRDEAPPLPLTLMHPHAYACACTHTHSRHICKGISTFDLGLFCTNGTSVRRGGNTLGFDLFVWPRRDSRRREEMADSLHFNVKGGERPQVRRHIDRPLYHWCNSCSH